MKSLLRSSFVLLILAAPAVAAAQGIDGYRLNVYAKGASSTATPITFFEFLNAAITCNVAPTPPPATPVINPRIAEWDDPANVGRVCRWQDPGTGPLLALPVGAEYEARLQAFNAAGGGPESNSAPFTRMAPPTSAPAGFKLRRLGL